jgi:polyvinyl alcohol dehydrogenase (cytochrome)
MRMVGDYERGRIDDKTTCTQSCVGIALTQFDITRRSAKLARYNNNDWRFVPAEGPWEHSKMDKAWFAIACLLSFSVSSAQTPAPEQGAKIFEQRCKSCHEPAIERAPSKADLAKRPRGDIVRALTSGLMMPMASGLSSEQILDVAAYLTPAAPSADASVGELAPSAATCKSNPPIKTGRSDWRSVAVDDISSRYQPNPGLKASDLPKLELKWAFSMTGGGQPTVVGDWLFVTNRGGQFYALDAKTGCVHWMVNDVVSRTTPMIVRSAISPSGWVTFIGVSSRAVKAFDAQTGALVWTSEVLEQHPASSLTGSPVVSGDQLFVPISSIEEAFAMRKEYVCCTFRGSLAALNLKTGKLQWKTPMITGTMQAVHREGAEKDLQGPAGAAVWASPTVDRKRGLVYVVTGDSYTDVDTDGSDAIVALDMKTGSVKWRNQVTSRDNYVMGCGPKSVSGNCPTPVGPDYDFGVTPILFNLKHGKQVLLTGQKSGLAYGFDPDTGSLLWKTSLGDGSALGGIEWGVAADREHFLVPVSDIGRLMHFNGAVAGEPPGRPGLYALDPENGRIVWQHAAPDAPCHYASDKEKPSMCVRSQSAAPAAMPGAVFQGGIDGWIRAYDSHTGEILWEYSTTAQTYDTLNGVKQQPGGAIDGMGPTIAGGMVYTLSGFNGPARVGSNGVNVLLAFGLPDKP